MAKSRFTTKKKDRDNFSKCEKNNITIYPVPMKGNSEKYFVEVNKNGKPLRTKDTYDEHDAWVQIFKYYEYYADKIR